MKTSRALLTFLFAASVVVSAHAVKLSEPFPSFDNFIVKYNRNYLPGCKEYAERKALYLQRVAAAKTHNERPSRRWIARANSLWDRTADELISHFGWQRRQVQSGLRLQGHNSSKVAFRSLQVKQRYSHPTRYSPESKSWAGLHVWDKVVQEQGSCGSCWAIAATTLLQAHDEIHTGSSRKLSVQELVSCVPNPEQCGGTGGCGGATMILALQWVLEHGCSSEDEVPYSSGETGNTGRCHAKSTFGGFRSGGPLTQRKAEKLQAWGTAPELNQHLAGMTSWKKLPQNTYEPLLHALVHLGPLGVSVSANEWLDYGSGIFDDCSRHAVVSHAVVLLAYGSEDGTKYWTIKNSWGRDWGENGYMRLLRHEDPHSWCGIDYFPEHGTGCKGGPPKVTVCGMCGILYSAVVPLYKS